MLVKQFHECPDCGGTLDREQFAVVKHEDGSAEVFMHCDFCSRGIERTVYADGEIYDQGFQAKTEPVNYGKFLQRLECARAA